jgi:predicted hotdog family 3-hydroxylacyl-ACP dehydratase
MQRTPPPIQDILPHRHGMLLVERILSWDAARASVSAKPDAAGWYAEAGGMPSRIGIELMAQAIATHVGVTAWERGEPPRKGVLLGARSYRATLAHFPAGNDLTVTAVKAFSDESGMGAYDATIALDGSEVAKARIIVFEPPDFEAFVAAQR